MRRLVFLGMGILESLVAVLLVDLGYQLPNSAEIDQSFASAGRVTDRAGAQVQLLRQNVDSLRAMELQELSSRLQYQTRAVSATLRAEPVDFDTVCAIRDALRDVAKGLRGLTETPDPKAVARSPDRAPAPAVDQAVARRPELRTTLERLATVLNTTSKQLDKAIEHREDYESAMEQTVQVADTFAAMLPLITDQLDGRLDDEEQTLAELGQSLEEVSAALPTYASTASRLMQAGRLLAWLVAAIIGLHGCYLMMSIRLGRRYSV